MTVKWLDPMTRWDEFIKMRQAAREGGGPILVFGLSESQKNHAVSSLLYPLSRQCLYITYNHIQAKRVYDDLRFYMEDYVMLLPPRDIVLYDVAAHSTEVSGQRLKVLEALALGEYRVVVASIEALLCLQTPPEIFKGGLIRVDVGQVFSIRDLAYKMVEAGYERVPAVEGPGQFSIRGGIVDVYPMTMDNPCRIEFFDDEVDSIRLFDPLSQRSTEKLDGVSISPARELVLTAKSHARGLEGIKRDLAAATKKGKQGPKTRVSALLEDMEQGMQSRNLENYFSFFYPENNSLFDYMSPESLVVLDEPSRMGESFSGWEEEFIEHFKTLLEDGEVLPGQGEIFISYQELMAQSEKFHRLALQGLPKSVPGYSPRAIFNVASRGIPSYQGKLDILAEDLRYWRGKRYSVILFAGSGSRCQSLVSNLYDLGIEATFSPGAEGHIMPGQIMVLSGNISGGFEYPQGKFAVISHNEIFGTMKHRRKSKAPSGKGKLDPFTDLKIGDFVVHEAHGIGKYLGIETLVINDQKRDYLNIKYGGTDRLYIPTDQVDIIQPYIGMDQKEPRLSRLGGAEWQRAKTKARQSVQKLAMDLVELYAARETTKGHQFSLDTPWQNQFEEMFPYEETPDQERAITDIKKDMESGRVMDRLLCGDVGYGKTEVAIRAAFKAVMDGKQAALLAPTTILAQQHFNTFVERFGDFPVKIQVLSRFRTPAQQRDILRALKQGNIDIIIGTHRLLGKDVVFKDLGLLVVDEEQRFGVGHKETIKNIRKNLDVLTLTATPIPRTLHMSLVGIRDISTIETPPEDRIPVQTYVVEYNDSLIRDAILKEVSRGGQVYFVYNRVRSMERMAERLRELVPQVRIRMAHGQMGESLLENVMLDFYDGKFDLLLCSTIIESGLDIPRVNTIIVYDSDYYGLSQLYQLRGRVGRSNRLAYAYLTYRKDKVLSEVAEKRLQAIKEFTEFGAGFKIAMRDLEIRGSGNILGPQQHGHMTAVGYELYCKLLDEEIKSLKGEAVPKPLDITIDIRVNAYIDDDYIPLEGQKIEIYKKIAAIEGLQDKYDIEEELEDRFGDMPSPVTNLIDIAYIKGLARGLGISEVSHRDREVILRLTGSKTFDSRSLMVLLNENRGRLRYEGMRRPMFRIILRDDAPLTALTETKDILEQMVKLG
ncbi:MAG TPA: transcription-repair coupling factor [Clostridia bacterium]|nr:transcription-repair coupling factor [Clostridia bacterium]